MAYLATIYMLLYVVSSVRTAPAHGDNVVCHINKFLKALSERTLVLDNRFACETTGDTIKKGEVCFHVYKCPLDFKEKDRHTPAICKSNGKWDYKEPLCEDLIPVASRIDLELLENVKKNAISRRRRRRRTQEKFSDADAVLLRIKRESHAPIEREISKEVHGTNFLMKFGFTMIRSTSTTQAPLEMEAPDPSSPEFEKKIDKWCSSVQKPLCKVANSKDQCQAMGKAKLKYFYKLCQICVYRGICDKSISLFSRSLP